MTLDMGLIDALRYYYSGVATHILPRIDLNSLLAVGSMRMYIEHNQP